jgi:glycosyltransferase involved in cell wall biosynthesis
MAGAIANPEITVGIPVYNGEDVIARAIESVQSQTWNGAFEILVVDDGSTDGTAGVVEGLAQDEDRIRLIRLPSNRGRPAARDRIVAEAKAPWLAWLDADDAWYPEKLERQMSFQHQKAAELGHTNLLSVCGYDLHNMVKDRKSARTFTADELEPEDVLGLTGQPFPLSQVSLVETDAVRRLGFDPALDWAEDMDFLLRFLDSGGRIFPIAYRDPLFIYYQTFEGRDPQRLKESHDHFFEKNAVLIRKHGIDPELVRLRKNFVYVARAFEVNGRESDAWALRHEALLKMPEEFGREYFRLLWKRVRTVAAQGNGSKQRRKNAKRKLGRLFSSGKFGSDGLDVPDGELNDETKAYIDRAVERQVRKALGRADR